MTRAPATRESRQIAFFDFLLEVAGFRRPVVSIRGPGKGGLLLASVRHRPCIRRRRVHLYLRLIDFCITQL